MRLKRLTTSSEWHVSAFSFLIKAKPPDVFTPLLGQRYLMLIISLIIITPHVYLTPLFAPLLTAMPLLLQTDLSIFRAFGAL